MKIALYVLSGVISTIIVVDAVYIFKLVVDDITAIREDSAENMERRRTDKCSL